MHALVRRLYPICRSMSGEGVRETLRILSQVHPIAVREVPTGTPAFDWEAPKEWVIRDAWIAGPDGRRLVDFRAHNLHVVNYSAPVRGQFTYEALRPHLHTLPDRPDLIPYRTSYWSETWGFCLTHRALEALGEGPFDVLIDAELKAGSLTLGEIVVPGAIADEIIVSTHTCHPSLANDNLSGLAVSVHLARALAAAPLRHTVRFLYGPGTIGSILWLALNEDITARIRHGLVLTGMGDAGPLVYKRSRLGGKPIDRVAEQIVAASGGRIIDYYPYGYDERQFCSPGFDLAVGRLSRTPHGEYPEYHTSGDTPDIVLPQSLTASYEAALAILRAVDREPAVAGPSPTPVLDGSVADRVVVSRNPKGEPRLGKRGLYRQVAGQANARPDEMALLWILAYADGGHSLAAIARRADMPFERIDAAARLLEAHDLVGAPG
jgi:aminopeptidase-like protein